MANQSASMAGAQTPGIDILLDRTRQRLQPQHVGNMTAALADHAGNIVLAVAEIPDKRTIAFRLFERIEIGALHVLDDRELQCFGVARLNDNDGDLMQSGALRRAPAS